jgi:hypothetical protein
MTWRSRGTFDNSKARKVELMGLFHFGYGWRQAYENLIKSQE